MIAGCTPPGEAEVRKSHTALMNCESYAEATNIGVEAGIGKLGR